MTTTVTPHDAARATFAGRFVLDDEYARREFDHAFGAYISRFHESWPVQNVLAALAELAKGSHEAQVLVIRQPAGGLSVTITAQLPAHGEKESSP